MKKRAVIARLMMASVALLALFLILAIAAFFGGRKVERDSVLISTDAVPGSIHANAMRVALAHGLHCSIRAALTDEAAVRAENLDLARGAEAAFHEAVAKYQATIRINPGQDRVLLEALSALFTTFTQKRTAFEALVRAGDRAGSVAFLDRELLPAYGPVREAAEALVAYNHANAVTYAKAIAGNIRQLHLTVAIILMLAVICGAILAANLSIRRREQREWEENERRTHQILDNLPALVGLCDPDGTLLEVNETALKVTGIRRENVIGRRFHHTPWWNHSPEVQKKLQTALQDAAEGRTARFDLENRTAEGGLMTVDFTCGPIRDAAGRVTHLVVSGIDVTERKKLEAQFLRAQRMDAIGTLSGGLAHDLNNILAPMLMAAGLLKVKLTSPGDRQMIDLIENGAQRGADIIRQLLTFGRGREGARANVQLRHLINDMVHIARETFPRSITIEHRSPADLRPIHADATQLHQVVLNLCLNARDAMPQGGQLSLIAENLDQAAVWATAHLPAEAAHYVALTVSDTGEGMPPDVLDHIFDPFFTTKPVGKGTGLGLPSVLGIVKGHGGLITVDSEPGEGTTFKIYLPAAEQPEIAAPAEALDELPSGRGELILLVDDEEAMREALTKVLKLHNYRVLVAANGQEAIPLFVEHRDSVRLVLTDVDMPVMGGPELIRSLRVLESDLRFLALTGSVHAEKQRELEELGVTAVLNKPCEPARLLKMLHQLFHPEENP